MPQYVDGYIIPLLKKQTKAYLGLARRAAKIWCDHGALEFRECVAEDVSPFMGVPFTRQLRCRPGETVIFSWIVFKSRAHRDRVNAAVMTDPRMLKMTKEPMAFDGKRMVYGGFTMIVKR